MVGDHKKDWKRKNGSPNQCTGYKPAAGRAGWGICARWDCITSCPLLLSGQWWDDHKENSFQLYLSCQKVSSELVTCIPWTHLWPWLFGKLYISQNRSSVRTSCCSFTAATCTSSGYSTHLQDTSTSRIFNYHPRRRFNRVIKVPWDDGN